MSTKRLLLFNIYNVWTAIISITFLLILPLSWNAHAEDSQVIFHRFDASNGLSDNSVQKILALSGGRMLVVTWRNINILDGYNVTVFPRDDRKMSSLPNHWMDYSVAEDDSGRVWVKEWEKLWCVDLKTGQQLANPLKKLHPATKNIFFDTSRGPIIVTTDSLITSVGTFDLPLQSSAVSAVMESDKEMIVFDMDGGGICSQF